MVGAVSWRMWKNIRLYRIIFSKPNIEKYVPEGHIREILGDDSIIAINSGSPGPEQKITVIAVCNGNPVFLKYGRTETAIKLVENEYSVLMSLQGSDLSPAVFNHTAARNFSFIKTELFIGKRLSEKNLNSSIIQISKRISSIDAKGSLNSPADLKTSFAHGDFCPWNLMDVNGTIKAFDWEMAGYYPMGYDIFTFVFQTNFLLNPGMKIEEILEDNLRHITDFFGSLDWKPYLEAFAAIKLDIESGKGNTRLVPHYQNLSFYAGKA